MLNLFLLIAIPGFLVSQVNNSLSFDGVVTVPANVLIDPENDAPVLTDIGNQETSEDNPLVLTLEAADLDEDDLTFSATSEYPENVAADVTGNQLTLTPAEDWNGSVNISVSVSDGELTDSEVFVLTVIPVNDAPTITLPESFTFEEDGSLTEDFSGYLSDIDEDELTLTVSGNENVTVSINGFEVTFGAVQDWNGAETLTFTVNDNQGRAIASDDADVIVTPVQDILFSSNWNLFSLNVEPMDANTVLEILEPVHSSLIYVFDEQFNLIRWDGDAGAWSDGIGNWMGTEGYYVKLSAGRDLEVPGSTIIEMPFDILLTSGWNIISFPTQSEAGQNVDAVFTDIMGSVEMIFNWNGSLYLPGGDPFVMYPGKAYLVKVTQNEVLIIDETGEFGGLYWWCCYP